MIITIAGMIGAGKSTVSRFLETKLKLKRYNMGELRRKMAAERGMTLAELNKLGEKERWADEEIDEYQKELGKKEDDFVIDGRLSWFFIPNSIKIFLTIDPKVGAERIFKEQRGKERGEKKWESAEEVEKANNERIESDIKRYQKLYKVNPYKIENFDIVIDTSEMTIEEMNNNVLEAVKKFID